MGEAVREAHRRSPVRASAKASAKTAAKLLATTAPVSPVRSASTVCPRGVLVRVCMHAVVYLCESARARDGSCARACVSGVWVQFEV
jgi:hypothetical protein